LHKPVPRTRDAIRLRAPRGVVTFSWRARLAGGRRLLHVTIPFEPEWPDNEVIEGLTLVDLDEAGPPWLRGTLHVLVLSISPEASDTVWLRHYDTVDGSDGRAL
jgi:hypothetical protein